MKIHLLHKDIESSETVALKDINDTYKLHDAIEYLLEPNKLNDYTIKGINIITVDENGVYFEYYKYDNYLNQGGYKKEYFAITQTLIF